MNHTGPQSIEYSAVIAWKSTQYLLSIIKGMMQLYPMKWKVLVTGKELRNRLLSHYLLI